MPAAFCFHNISLAQRTPVAFGAAASSFEFAFRAQDPASPDRNDHELRETVLLANKKRLFAIVADLRPWFADESCIHRNILVEACQVRVGFFSGYAAASRYDESGKSWRDLDVEAEADRQGFAGQHPPIVAFAISADCPILPKRFAFGTMEHFATEIEDCLALIGIPSRSLYLDDCSDVAVYRSVRIMASLRQFAFGQYLESEWLC